ncbi:MAG: hypothetical protein Q7U57_17870 [Methylovulum sp.]|nr:hypothetical protein [Methylovulum sp.]
MNVSILPLKKLFPLFLLALLIAACNLTGCSNTDKQTGSVQQAVKKFAQPTTLQGQVIGKNQPIKTGQIIVTGNKGQLLGQVVLQDSNHYQVVIPAHTELPVVLRFYPEPNSPEAEQLVVVVVEPTLTQYDLSPLTTAIAKKAEALGGYTRTNLVMAAESMVNAPDANKTSTGFRGDPTTQYGGWH